MDNKETHNRRFLVVEFAILENQRYRHLMTSAKGIEMTYQWLRHYIIRGPMMDPCKLEVFYTYYLDGWLATTIREETLAKQLNISRALLRRNIEALKQANLIIVKKLKHRKGGKKQRAQNVYVLGKWKSEKDLAGNETIVEFLFEQDYLIDDFMKPYGG
jgi:hypothetical protein